MRAKFEGPRSPSTAPALTRPCDPLPAHSAFPALPAVSAVLLCAGRQGTPPNPKPDPRRRSRRRRSLRDDAVLLEERNQLFKEIVQEIEKERREPLDVTIGNRRRAGR